MAVAVRRAYYGYSGGPNTWSFALYRRKASLHYLAIFSYVTRWHKIRFTRMMRFSHRLGFQQMLLAMLAWKRSMIYGDCSPPSMQILRMISKTFAEPCMSQS